MNLAGGTPVAINGDLNFDYTIQFSGAELFSIGQEVIPVPEPGAFGLVLLGAGLFGGLGIIIRRK